MKVPTALIAMGVLMVVALIMFGNELYYRKRVSALGIIIMVCTAYLMWYMHDVTSEMLSMVERYNHRLPIKILKGEP